MWLGTMSRSVPGSVEVSAALFHPDRLGIRDLHMIDIAAVPDGLKDGIVEAEHHDVLHRFFAQVMIDAVNLVFRQHSFDVAIQGFGGVEIVTKRLLDDHSPPVSIVLADSPPSQLLYDLREKFRSSRQIKKIICVRVVLSVHRRELGREGRISGRIGEVATLIVEPLREPRPRFRAAVFRQQESGYLVTKLFRTQVVERYAHHRKIAGKQLCLGQVKERWNQLALGQIA